MNTSDKETLTRTIEELKKLGEGERSAVEIFIQGIRAANSLTNKDLPA